MICKKCGTENKETAKFCKNCGSRLEKEENKETAEIVKETETEEKKKESRICPFCGAEVSETAMFCKKCGEKLNEKENNTDIYNDETVLIYEQNYDDRNRKKEERSGKNSENMQIENEKYREGDKEGASSSGNVYNSVHIDSNCNTITEDQLPAKYKPIGAWAYFGWTLLFSIPVAGLIVALVFAVGNTENINLRNFARSMFCYLAVVAILIILIVGGAGCTAGMLL